MKQSTTASHIPGSIQVRSLFQVRPFFPGRRVALTAGLTGEARRQAEAARAAGLDQRRLWLLLAEIEGDGDASRDALQHALVAEPNPTWRCTSCHATQATWQPVCPVCGTVGGLR